jgi:pilus assembly protein CpaB
MRPKSLILLMLALGCGLVASIGISQILDGRNPQAPAQEMEPILVAVKEAKFNDALTPETVKLEEWPRGKIPAGALTKLEQIEGRRARTQIVPGEPILESKLLRHDEGKAANVIPKGYRVVSVHADSVSSTGNLIQPRDRVDVLVYIRRGSNASGTKTILQDVEVFAVNEQWRPPEEGTGDTIAARTISLLVTPAQAEKVALASEMGKIRLVLRSPDDDANVTTTGAREADFLSGPEKMDREPAKPDAAALALQQPLLSPLPAVSPEEPKERFTMELLHGGELRTIDFTRHADQSRWKTAGGTPPSAGGAAPFADWPDEATDLPKQAVPLPIKTDES